MVAFDNTPKAREVQDPLEYAVASRDHDAPRLVREALSAGRCLLAFQPVARRDGGIAFYEGLIRIKDEAGRILPARTFVSDVEDTELGRDLDTASLSLGFEMLRNNPGLRLSINVSARSLGDSAWRAVLNENIDRNTFLEERLILEIGAGSAMMLPEVVARFMKELQPLGVAFALDDFGAGLTSFRNLRSFYFDLVKIDRFFVSGVADDPDNQVMVGALLSIAHQFDMFAVATGVERRVDAEWLAAAGVDCLQGFHTGVPRFSLLR
ncbi:EAL domain-containing protein [Roseisalinus antarcticus]|uniref:Cyclic di-GMP phosphodiesterase Gmr n=1 Tax=Roseisalinus antarcticus TaxID=254357 RepID=A0A1Y5RMV7_9RHOB|nr:EAL domain-containing protein [Roseisalinus antarcticus]SLN21218.1 Cyclic di-GMP phosphodiesterase Gmr [Roseisalinus antarcticus]